MLCDSTELEKRQAELKEELEVVVGLVERCVAENARTALDQMNIPSDTMGWSAVMKRSRRGSMK